MTPEQIEARRARGRKLAADRKASRAADKAAVQAEIAAVGKPPALGAADVLKAIAAMRPEERAALAAILAPAQAIRDDRPEVYGASPMVRAQLPDGANPYAILPLDVSLKEALFELGATDRVVNAVRTSVLAMFLVKHGRPKKSGRTYEGDEHVRETEIDLRLMAEQARRVGAASPLAGWFRFVGGQASGSPDNYEWSIPDHALAEALAEGRKVTPAERAPAAAPQQAGVPLRAALPDGAVAYAEDLAPGKHTAAEVQASIQKVVYEIAR